MPVDVDYDYGIYDHVKILEGPCVLFRDFNGSYAPLVALYWSTSSAILVSRHPSSSVEEIVSIYCPQCLNRYVDDDVRTFQNRCPTCLECPMCCGMLNKMTSSEGRYSCLCGWTASEVDCSNRATETRRDRSVPVTTTSDFDLAHVFFNAVSESLNLQISCMDNPLNKFVHVHDNDLMRHWQLPDLDLTLAAKTRRNCPFMGSFRQRFDDSKEDMDRSGRVLTISGVVDQLLKYPSQPVAMSNVRPRRVQLRSRCTVRCRKDVEECKMSILVQPKRNPLDGDSFSTTRGKSSFFVKDSSAVQQLPNLVITRVPAHRKLCTGVSEALSVTITNPKSIPIRIRLENDSRYETRSLDGAFDVRSVQRLMLASGDSSILGREIGIAGYEDELLRDDDADDSAAPGRFGDAMPDSDGISSLIMFSHNSLFLRCAVCTESTGCGDATETLGGIYVLPLLLNIVEVDVPSSTPEQYEVIIAFPSE